jgi:hypothetical protein
MSPASRLTCTDGRLRRILGRFGGVVGDGDLFRGRREQVRFTAAELIDARARDREVAWRSRVGRMSATGSGRRQRVGMARW